MTVRNKDNTEERRVVVHGRKPLEDHPHLISSVQRKSTSATMNLFPDFVIYTPFFPKTCRLIKNANVSSFSLFKVH